MAWSGKRPAKSLGTRTWRALNALLSPAASPEGSGEPWKECEYEQLWDHIQDGPEGRDDAWGELGLGRGGLEKGG